MEHDFTMIWPRYDINGLNPVTLIPYASFVWRDSLTLK